MTVKKTIIHLAVGPSLASADFWRVRLADYFDFIAVDPADDLSSYSKNDCVLWTSHLEPEWYRPWADEGFKVVYDKLWDHFGTATLMEPNVLLLLSDNFIFVNEVLKYKWRGVDKIELKKTDPDKFFLCLMNAERPHRSQLYDRIHQYDNEALISYIDKGIYVEGDTNHNENSAWHSYLNPEWYSRTYFSLVAETSVQTIGHMSEKMFKPFAFKHPMLLWASQNTLGCAKKLGFQTFNGLFDEQHDNFIDSDARLDSIVNTVNQYYQIFKNNKEEMKALFVDNPKIKEVLDHNHNLFYSEQLLSRLIKTEFIEPLLEFVNA